MHIHQVSGLVLDIHEWSSISVTTEPTPSNRSMSIENSQVETYKEQISIKPLKMKISLCGSIKQRRVQTNPIDKKDRSIAIDQLV